MAEQQQRNPNLMNPKAMQAVAGTRGIGENVVLFSEVLTKVNNAKDKPKKVAVLKEFDNAPLRQVLKGAFDPSIKWDLPDGNPPFIANEAPIGTEHGLLRNEAKRLWHFVTGADNQLTKTQKETMFIQILEGLHKNEADVLLGLSGVSLNSGRKILDKKKIFICERASSHIVYQDNLLADEYKIHNRKYIYKFYKFIRR